VTAENGPPRGEDSIMALFRKEVEHHTAAISDGLLALESHPNASDRLDAMIRAAHAIKGGAQIVDLEPAADVARTMESCFIAAQKGDISIEADEIEILLQCVDLLNRMTHEIEAPEGVSGSEEEVAGLITAMNSLLVQEPMGETAAPSPAAQTARPPSSEAVPEATPLEPENTSDAKPPPTAADPAMLELFRTEVQNHIAVLNDGLLALERDPGEVNRLEPLMRAAHSIRGAARIVGVQMAASVSTAMESCFSAAQKGAIALGSDKIHILLKGVDLLNRITEAAEERAPGARELPYGEADELIRAMEGMLSQESPAPGPYPGDGSSGPVPEKPGVSEVAAQPVVVDPAMLDLFQTEVETHVAVLNDGLLALETNPEAKDQLEALMRAAHSIKGGARVLGLDVAVRAAHVMEDCFVAAQKGEVLLGSDQIDILLRIVDILTQLAQSLSEGETDWLGQHREEIERLVSAISVIVNGESAIPVSPLETEPPETATAPAPQGTEPVPVPAKADVGMPAEREVEEILPQHMEERDRTVRVTAGKIERLMGQAGEVVVNARWLPAFSDALVELKRTQGELLTILDGLQEILMQKGDIQVSELLLHARKKTKEASRKLGERLNQFDIFNSTSAALSDRLYHEVISVRMRPFADGVQGFPRLVRDIARELGKRVRLEIKGKATEVDRDILEKLDAPLNHLLRNAVDHGIEPPEERLRSGKPETGTLSLEAAHRSGMLMITLSDDGRGIDLNALRQKIVQKGLTSTDMVDKMTDPELMDFLFLPGFSTARQVTEISGRGVGLDVVRNMVHEVGGVVRAISRPGEGLIFHMELPLTLSVVRTFLVEIGGEPYAFPLARIERCLELPRSEISTVEDRQYFRFDDTNIAVVDIHNVLELKVPPEQKEELHVVVVSDRLNFYGLSVDRFLGEYDLVVRPLDPRLGKVPDISSVAVMLDGSPVLIFDVEDLVRSIDNLLTGRRLRKLSREATPGTVKEKKRILVVDDSFTVREMERKLLENRGYIVETAVDGVDGWNAVRAEHYDMVVSDVDMPRMNGIEFVKQIKQHPELKALPVIIVSYKDKEEDRLMGLEAGANYYLTKSSFEDDSLIHAAVDLIGEA